MADPIRVRLSALPIRHTFHAAIAMAIRGMYFWGQYLIPAYIF